MTPHIGNRETTMIARHRTAILRRALSKPVALALEDFGNELTGVLDYGCGYGEDVKFLKGMNIPATGYDPYYAPETEIKPAPMVNLGYVLNILENPAERKNVLRTAWSLTERLLCVSVMIRDNSPRIHETAFGDGVLTSWNTFQKYFSQKELRDYLAQELYLPPQEVWMAAQGVAYLFKDENLKEVFLSARLSRAQSGITALLKENEYKRVITEWINVSTELGRVPGKAEFPDYNYIIKIFGSRRAATLAIRTEVNTETMSENAARRKGRLMATIARTIIENRGKAQMRDLSLEHQTDVKLFYQNFQNAMEAVLQNLKNLANLETISAYFQESRVGKILPDDIYIHRSAMEFAPDMLQILTELANMAIPEDFPWDIVKIARNAHHVTFLEYPDFFTEPHPPLHGSMKVHLATRKMNYRDYRNSGNPPILHRKETFLYYEHPSYEIFSQLTRDEEEAGLLSRPDIGNQKQFAAILGNEGYRIEDHRLVK